MGFSQGTVPGFVIVNLAELMAAFSIDAESEILNLMDREIVPTFEGTMREAAPNRTGRLRNAIQTSRSGNVWDIYEDTPYGRAVTGGAVGHSIYPKVKKALFWEGLPHPISWCAHPGQKTNPFHIGAAETCRSQLVTMMDAYGSNLVIRMAVP